MVGQVSDCLEGYKIIQFNSIQLYSHKKHYSKIHQENRDINTTKSYGGVGWKANEA